MARIKIYILLIISCIYLVYAGIDPDHERFLAEEQITCGLTIEKNSAGARMINGKVPAKVYPWMVRIQRYTRYGSLSRFEEWDSRSSGSIITKTFILTCAHCICETPNEDEYHPTWLSNVVCKDPQGSKESNQLWNEHNSAIEFTLLRTSIP